MTSAFLCVHTGDAGDQQIVGAHFCKRGTNNLYRGAAPVLGIIEPPAELGPREEACSVCFQLTPVNAPCRRIFSPDPTISHWHLLLSAPRCPTEIPGSASTTFLHHGSPILSLHKLLVPWLNTYPCTCLQEGGSLTVEGDDEQTQMTSLH